MLAKIGGMDEEYRYILTTHEMPEEIRRLFDEGTSSRTYSVSEDHWSGKQRIGRFSVEKAYGTEVGRGKIERIKGLFRNASYHLSTDEATDCINEHDMMMYIVEARDANMSIVVDVETKDFKVQVLEGSEQPIFYAGSLGQPGVVIDATLLKASRKSAGTSSLHGCL